MVPGRTQFQRQRLWLVCIFLVLNSGQGVAQDEPTAGLESLNWSGEIEIGGRTTWGDDESGKLREYRDFEQGVLGQINVRVEDEDRSKFLRLFGSNLGYNDQRYELEAGRYGRFKLDLFYRELPHIFSTKARTLYQRPSGNQFFLPGGVQTNIDNAASASTQLGLELQAARPIDLGFRQIEGGTGLEYHVNDAVRLFGRYRLQDREGSRATAIQFGSPGGSFNVFAGPIDDQTHQLEAGVEYATDRLMLGLEYRGSFYENEYRSVSIDNPLVELDAANAATRGRSSLDPDNSAHTISAFGSVALPVSFPTRVVANLAYGLRLQNDSFIPHTLNSAIASPALVANSLDGEIHTLTANLVATARPLPKLNLKARYRVYHYDDETDSIRFPAWVRNDDAARTDAFRSVRNDYTRQDAEISSSYRLTSSIKSTLGYELEAWHRSNDRQVEDLREHGPVLKVDWRLNSRATLRAAYAFKDREGDGYDPLAFFRAKLDPADFAALQTSGVSELPSLRKFDQADRQVHRISIVGHVIPSDHTDLTIDAGWKDVDYGDTDFGLTEQRSWHVGVDGFYQIHSRVGLGLWYSFEEVVSDQTARWRPRNFVPPIILVDDARNDWKTDNESLFHSLGSTLTITAIPDRLDLELGYQLHLGREKTGGREASGFVGTGGVGVGNNGGASFAYPDVEETLHVLTGTASLEVNARLKLRAQYRFEDFELKDFRTDDLGPFRGGNDVYLGNSIDDYRAHILVVSAVLSL